MLLRPGSAHDVSLTLVEGCLTAIALAAAFAWPRLCGSRFGRLGLGVARGFSGLARRRGLACVSVGAAAVLLRLAMLPVAPVPLPYTPDDFSNLLAADTFAHGRLTNPTPAMWTHFESIHISMQPSYMSMYFPAQGLALAAGKVLFGEPWFGILLTGGLMCAGLCWMLQVWLPPGWALLGGWLAVLRLSLFSYWINTYTGAGFIAGLGGALVLGALPRLMRTARQRYGLAMAAGIALLLLSRPYEGMLLCLPVAAALGRWALKGKNRPAPAVLLRRAAGPLLLATAAAAWLGYYDYRAFGNPLTLPYTANRAAYAIAPYYVWQRPRLEPVYRHDEMRRFYRDNELKAFELIHSRSGFIPQTLWKAARGVLFYAGLALLAPLIMLRRVLLDRRMRFMVVCVLAMTVGMAIEIFMIPHYLAPFTAAFYAIGLQAMRHLRVWKPEGRPVGAAMTRLIVAVCVAMGAMRLFAGPLGMRVGEWPPAEWANMWYGPEHFGVERAEIEERLKKLPGKQLVLVRYSGGHNPLDEWVYNAADIDGAKVVWAREMDAAGNEELMRYYSDRTVWLAEPDRDAGKVEPYRTEEMAAALRH